MRRAGFILCLLILAGGFATVWVVLSPDETTPHSSETAEASETSPQLQPLDSPGTVSSPTEDETPDDPIGIDDAGDESGPPGEERSDPEDPTRESNPRVNTRRPTPQPSRESDKTEEGGASDDTEDTGEAPVPPSKPEPFIKGHKRPAGQNLGNRRPRSRRISQPSGVKKLEDVTPKLRQDRRGLYAQYFGLNSADLTKLDKTDPDMVRIDRQVYFPDRDAFSDLPIALDNFAAEWTGFLVIDEPGDYWLFWGADNGGRVELDGETVLLQDGMVRYVEVSTVLTLEAGLHPLKIEFAQTKNNVADWAKCAAVLMYVPEGESKPVPVPSEMLMVPEWMWTDNAPIITSLSKTEGEIGDEITIKGQGLYDDFDYGDGLNELYPKVTVAGQLAEVIGKSSTSLKVRIPIGAKTGNVIVYKVRREGDGNGSLAVTSMQPRPGPHDIPSNSVTFTVTTQFGLMAEWHNLPGWSNFEFVDSTVRSPDLVRLEATVGFDSREDLASPYRENPFACRWVGKLGLPTNWIPADKSTWVEIQTRGRLRVTLGDTTKETTADDNGGSAIKSLRFMLDGGNEQLLSLTIEMADWSGEASLRLVKLGNYHYEWPNENEKGALIYEEDYELPAHWFIPAVVPPKPPEISLVSPVSAEGEQPVSPPYDVDGSRPVVRVGQEFTFELVDFGPEAVWESYPTVTIDGVPLEFTIQDILENQTLGEGEDTRILSCRATMPDGVGEGRMVARLSIVNSEPYLIDIANRGLVSYLYDVPEGSGLNELPDLGPLHCFKVRKDRQINFESAADFDLPFPAETFVIEWLGGLVIEEEGDYDFICRSDDGMMLWLDDNVVIDANHRQAPAENKATVHLVPGTYRFRMQFFENNQHEVCVLEWRATRGEGEMLEELIPRQVIPARAFSLDVHPPFPAKTSTGKKTDGS